MTIFDKKKLEEELAGKAKSDHPLSSLGETVPHPRTDTGKNSGPALPEDPTKSQTAKEAKATRDELATAADRRQEAGEAAREAANEKNDALYAELTAFTKKQDSRYDDLLSLVLANDYKNTRSGTALIGSAVATGRLIGGAHAAQAIGENGGNGDSYSSALYNRAIKNQYAIADRAARESYGEQLDRILSVIQAAGDDMQGLYGTTQDNIDTAQEAATDDLSLAADLYKLLTDAQADAGKVESDVYSALLDRADKTQDYSISPMQLDAEYEQMTKTSPEAKTPTAALMLLWDKYPSMRSYIMQKYEKLQAETYTFKEDA